MTANEARAQAKLSATRQHEVETVMAQIRKASYEGRTAVVVLLNPKSAMSTATILTFKGYRLYQQPNRVLGSTNITVRIEW